MVMTEAAAESKGRGGTVLMPGNGAGQELVPKQLCSVGLSSLAVQPVAAVTTQGKAGRTRGCGADGCKKVASQQNSVPNRLWKCRQELLDCSSEIKGQGSARTTGPAELPPQPQAPGPAHWDLRWAGEGKHLK